MCIQHGCEAGAPHTTGTVGTRGIVALSSMVPCAASCARRACKVTEPMAPTAVVQQVFSSLSTHRIFWLSVSSGPLDSPA